MNESEPLRTKSQTRRHHLLEIWSAVLLSLATVCSAWSAYQATVWSGIQAIRFNEASAARVQAASAADTAAQLTAIDVNTFIAWASAFSGGDERLERFLFQRFRPEFKKAVDAWIATEPQKNPDAPPTPFRMPEYQLEAQQQAERLTEQAESKVQAAKAANRQGDEYVLLTVIFASVLFFAGISTKFESFRIRVVLTALGTLLFLGAFSFIILFPKAV